MPKRTIKKTPNGRGILTVLLAAALGVGVFAAYVRMTPNANHVPNDLREHSTPKKEVSAPPVHHRGPSVEVDSSSSQDLKIPVLKGGDVTLGPDAGTPPKGMNPMVFLATATLKQLKIEGARALSVDIHGRNALIDFNDALDKGYGSTEEGQLIKSLQWALGQFPTIDTFQIVIDGKIKDTLGQIDLSDPIPVTRPDGKDAVPADSPKTDEAPPTP